jgi:hypothetical protein
VNLTLESTALPKFKVIGPRDVVLLLTGSVEVLKPQWNGEVIAEDIEDVLVRDLFEGDPRRVEVPVVIEPVRAGIVRAAMGKDLFLPGVAARDVNTGARHHELLEGGVLFGIHEESRVFKAELNDGLVQVVV